LEDFFRDFLLHLCINLNKIMQVIAIDLNDALKQDKNEITPFLARMDVKRGDKLEIFMDEDVKGALQVAVLTLIWVALYHLSKTGNLHQIGQASTDAVNEPGVSFSALSKLQTPIEMEEVIERKLGVEIEFIDKSAQVEDPFAETFGIWKNRKMEIENFRDEAWRKTK